MVLVIPVVVNCNLLQLFKIEHGASANKQFKFFCAEHLFRNKSARGEVTFRAHLKRWAHTDSAKAFEEGRELFFNGSLK
jgi:hypothetical protein